MTRILLLIYISDIANISDVIFILQKFVEKPKQRASATRTLSKQIRLGKSACEDIEQLIISVDSYINHLQQ